MQLNIPKEFNEMYYPNNGNKLPSTNEAINNDVNNLHLLLGNAKGMTQELWNFIEKNTPNGFLNNL